MTTVSWDKAFTLAARLKAYDWCWQHLGLPYPILPSGGIDEEATRLHGLAWAWADQNWVGFLSEVEDGMVRDLLDILNRAAELGRRRRSRRRRRRR
jgi:hypothetical protein